jgi:hypothetical protein
MGNGSGAISVKSGFLTHISSAATPMTRISKQSSLAKTGQSIFTKYRAKSKAINHTDDIFAAKLKVPNHQRLNS